MSDPAHAATDDILKKIERRVAAEYRRAVRDTQEKLDDYLRRFEIKDEIKRRKLAANEITKKEYNDWRLGQIMMQKRWEELRDTLAQDYHNANLIARSIVNGYMPEVYALNHNYGTFEVERGSLVDTSYTLYNRQTVERIIRDNPDILSPFIGKSTEAELQAYQLQTGKDLHWQAGQIQSVTMQAILQGESIPNMSRRIARTMGEVNHKSTIRYARTAITSAENAGRLDSYWRAKGMGIQVKKTWLATLDRRTRHAHRQLDGQTRPIDEPYDSLLGKIMYPGDPDAAPANIWNCFVGKTNVASNSEIVRSYKHRYSGELITITTSRGVKFTCTPNHPILTPFGWAGANRLHKGDHIIIARFKKDDPLGVNPHVDHAFPRIETIHKFFRKIFASRASGLSVNFHGDRAASNVEVISKERLLRENVDSSGDKTVNKFFFKNSNSFVFTKSHFVSCFRRIDIATFCFMRRIGKMFSLFRSIFRHSVIHCFRSISRFDPSTFQPESDAVSPDIKFFGNRLYRSTGEEFADDIIAIDVSTVKHVPVYNLQTKNGYYFVNTIIQQNAFNGNDYFAIVHNCRCTQIVQISGFERDVTDRNLRHDKHLGDMTYQEWKEEKQSISHPITKQEEIAEAMRWKYIREDYM